MPKSESKVYTSLKEAFDNKTRVIFLDLDFQELTELPESIAEL